MARGRKDEDMDVSKGKMTVQEAGKKGGSKTSSRARELGEEDRERTER